MLRSSELAASGESLPSSPNPLPPPDVELPADKSEDNSALRDALDPPPLPPAFLVVALLLSFFWIRRSFQLIVDYMESLLWSRALIITASHERGVRLKQAKSKT